MLSHVLDGSQLHLRLLSVNAAALQHRDVDFRTDLEAQPLVERYGRVIGLPGMQESLVATSLDASHDGSGVPFIS